MSDLCERDVLSLDNIMLYMVEGSFVWGTQWVGLKSGVYPIAKVEFILRTKKLYIVKANEVIGHSPKLDCREGTFTPTSRHRGQKDNLQRKWELGADTALANLCL